MGGSLCAESVRILSETGLEMRRMLLKARQVKEQQGFPWPFILITYSTQG